MLVNVFALSSFRQSNRMIGLYIQSVRMFVCLFASVFVPVSLCALSTFRQSTCLYVGHTCGRVYERADICFNVGYMSWTLGGTSYMYF